VASARNKIKFMEILLFEIEESGARREITVHRLNEIYLYKVCKKDLFDYVTYIEEGIPRAKGCGEFYLEMVCAAAVSEC